MPKRPLDFGVFAGNKYYPSGGWYDYKASYTSLITALEAVAEMECDWWQIVDLRIGQIVKSGERW